MNPVLFVGLGNPGPEYDQTRHNIGYMALDHLAKSWSVSFKEERKFQGWYGSGNHQGHRVHLLKPTTYMNNSGQAVRALCDWFKLEPSQVLVIYDELALPTGRLRLRAQGSAAGHNGVKSLIQHLGTQDFPRLRIGIDSDRDSSQTIGYVLGRFSQAQRALLPTTLDAVEACIDTIFKEDFAKAMSIYNAWSAE
jgi:peptidyl-tRNA hydrolase, PTH1 family